MLLNPNQDIKDAIKKSAAKKEQKNKAASSARQFLATLQPLKQLNI